MRTLLIALLATVALPVAGQKDAYAQLGPGKTQSRGMFGNRALGETVRPRPRTFAGFSMRSYEGSFLGRGADVPSRMFKSYRSPQERSPLPAPARLWAEGLRPPEVVEVVEATVAQPVELEPAGLQPRDLGPDDLGPDELGPDDLGPERPDIWFRSPPGSSDTGAAADGVPAGPIGDLAPGVMTGPRFVRPLSTQYAVGFTRKGTGPIASRAELSMRITRSLADRVRSPISISLEDGTATLRGKVARSHDRTLASLLILMEPGIWKVDNRLTIETPELLSGGPNR